ncbi:hypothetical protein [Kitasatospora sp. CB02891]|uniref:hypothetical protein n=1 Tax=Kitasatospora sp. CB02891 TaxID=2020329 RepID=UPI000C271A46|nr:hypothetical protein [Kitasatospora sp. CB02891]PJN24026.1 hypothetical protein CG736_19200 [Kitasatospora sp. CB02891]
MAYAEKVYKVKHGKPTKSYTWKAKFLLPDGINYGSKSGFPTEKTAKDYGLDQEADIRAGRWIDPKLSSKHFGTWTQEFMRARPKRGQTVDTRWKQLQGHILPRWQHTPLRDITWFAVDAWQVNDLRIDDVSKGHVVSLMSTILTAAVDARHLLANPLVGRRRTKPVMVLGVVPKKADESKWYPPAQVIQVAERLGFEDGFQLLSAAFTGVNWGEGLGLESDHLLTREQLDIDGTPWSCPVLRLVQEVAEYEERGPNGEKLGTVLRLEPLKNEHRIRDVDIPPFLAGLWQHRAEVWPHRFLLSTESGSWWRRGNWGKTIRPAADGRPARERRRGVAAREGWEPLAPGLTMRGARHTHDTLQEQIMVAASLMYEQAGHKPRGIKGVYQHPTVTMRQHRLDGLQTVFVRAMLGLGKTTLWGLPVDLELPQK